MNTRKTEEKEFNENRRNNLTIIKKIFEKMIAKHLRLFFINKSFLIDKNNVLLRNHNNAY